MNASGTTRDAAHAAATTLHTPLTYQSGFGNEFATEALAGALPVGQNSPQRVWLTDCTPSRSRAPPSPRRARPIAAHGRIASAPRRCTRHSAASTTAAS